MPTLTWMKTCEISITAPPYMACRQSSQWASLFFTAIVTDSMIMGRSTVSSLSFRSFQSLLSLIYFLGLNKLLFGMDCLNLEEEAIERKLGFELSFYWEPDSRRSLSLSCSFHFQGCPCGMLVSIGPFTGIHHFLNIDPQTLLDAG